MNDYHLGLSKNQYLCKHSPYHTFYLIILELPGRLLVSKSSCHQIEDECRLERTQFDHHGSTPQTVKAGKITCWITILWDDLFCAGLMHHNSIRGLILGRCVICLIRYWFLFFVRCNSSLLYITSIIVQLVYVWIHK